MASERAAAHEALFSPRSVAVVGASNREGTVGQALFRNLLAAGFRGVAYPVNPSWSSVSGVRCYTSVRALPEAPDLGVVIVPAPGVPAVVDQLGAKGARAVIVVSAGFGEIGGRGAELERDLVRRARKHDLTLIGPNCFGAFNTDPAVQLNATFSDALPPRGHIAFVSQSGALGAGILRYALAERVGFSRFVSVGNRAGITESGLLPALSRDPATRVILLYVESLADGRRFLEVARSVTARTPVLVIKSGRSPVGERAARSHTGALARSAQDALYDALFAQAGVLRAESLGDLFRMAKIFASGLSLPGNRVAILTNSGGPGIVAADACARGGLEVPTLSARARATLARAISPWASAANPVDMTADATPGQYRTALEYLLHRREFDAGLVIATPTGETSVSAVADAVLAARARSGKPVVACLFGLTDVSRDARRLEAGGVPTYTFPEEAVQALSGLARYREWWSRPRTRIRRFRVDRRRIRDAVRRAQEAETRVLPQYLARELLEAYGLRFPASRRATTLDGARAAAAEVGYPVALKVASPDIPHKTDVGGVVLGLGSDAELAGGWDRIHAALAERAPNARIEGFEVEAMVTDGKEVLVGLQRDPVFGPVIAFGLGGIYVEVLKDVTFRLAPLRTLSAQHMVSSVRAFPLLTGVRGEPPSDLNALYEAIERVSQLATEREDVLELDVNPLLVRPKGRGAIALDARVVLDPSSKSGSRP